MKIISIANQKGGVGKTTTAINLSVALSELGKRVLVVDLDPQANLTMGFGIDYPDELEYTISNIILSNKNINREKYIKIYGKLQFIPASIELVELEDKLSTAIGRESYLGDFLEQFKNDYDYCIIDCLPSLNILTVNALCASDEVIIPVQSQYFSVKGLELLLNTIATIKSKINKKLQIAGVVFTMLDGRSTFQKNAAEIVKIKYGELLKIFNTYIPPSVKVSDNQSKGISIVSERGNNAGRAYMDLALEYLKE
ncbi:MAG: AAA family ATPase [Defluviitaleaceae bacterium]|nr:AAA family ATPase [Defluviitaleaceae bacterium]